MAILKKDGNIRIIIGGRKLHLAQKILRSFLPNAEKNILRVFNILLGNHVSSDKSKWIELNKPLAKLLTKQVPKRFRKDFSEYMEFYVCLAPAVGEEIIAFKTTQRIKEGSNKIIGVRR